MIILSIACLAVGVLSQNSNCRYGDFTSNSNTCMFDCEYNSNYVSIASLSFNFIREQCDNVQEAYDNGICDSLDDLVYRNDNCACPYCKCSSVGTELVEKLTNEPSQECSNCTCKAAPSYYGITDNIYQCDELIEVSNAWEWDLYACPPNECTDTSYDNYTQTYHAGDKWWADNGDYTATCDTFCYCPATGNAICRSGYADILGIYPGLKNAFIDQCGYNAKACYDMESESYDVDRLFTTDTGPSCSWNCPSCSCPTGKVENDTWYHESQDLYDLSNNRAECSLCTCKKDYMGNLYSDCEYSDSYTVGARACPPTSDEVYTCHQQDSSTSSGVSGSINPTECSIGNDGPVLSKNYCQWSYDGTLFDGSNAGEYSWGCGIFFCEAFADDKCVYANTTYTYTDCYGVEQTEILSGYLSCCDASTENCNYESASLDECTRSTAYEEFWTGLYNCSDFDEDCNDEVDEITCEGITTLYEARYSCYCSVYADIYANLGTESQVLVQAEIDSTIGTEFPEWNDELGCSIAISCDLSTGEISSDGSTVTTETPTGITDCEWGNFDTNYDNGVCMFQCEDNDYVSISSLSFDQIRSRCSDVQDAYENGICDSLDDLIYSDDYCGCPYCKCTESSSSLIEVKTNQPSKYCTNCTCTDVSWSGINDKIYKCNELISAYNPWEWDLYSCPPNQCVVTNDEWGYSNTYYAGRNWWSDVADGETCNKFCYCPASGDAVCQTGYANILGIYPALKNQFIDSCGYRAKACYDMDSGSYDVDRLFTTDTGSSCYDCPYCSCPTGKVEGDTWYHETQNLYDLSNNNAECNLCTCSKDSSGNLYAECDYSDSYTVGARSCPPTSSELYSCHSEESTLSSPSTLNSITCTPGNDGVPLNTNYCTWGYNDIFEGDNDGYAWGCGTSMFCEAFASDGCVYADTSYTFTDCYGVTQTQTLNGYLGCCDASSKDNCNYETISLDECTQSTEYETFFTNLFNCQYNSEVDFCEDEVDEITCDGIQALYEAQYGCYCGAYADIYALVSTESKALLQTAIDDSIGSEFAGWNEALDCDISISCDLSSGVISDTPLPTTSEPTDVPTPAPVEVIENECEEECTDTQTCNSSGECVDDVVIPDDGPCTSNSACDDGYLCETLNNGGFCFYDECLYTGECEDGFTCVSKTKTQSDVEYKTGVCEKIGGEGVNSAQGFKVFVSIIIGLMIIMNFI